MPVESCGVFGEVGAAAPSSAEKPEHHGLTSKARGSKHFVSSVPLARYSVLVKVLNPFVGDASILGRAKT